MSASNVRVLEKPLLSPADAASAELMDALRRHGYSFVTPTPATYERNLRRKDQATTLRDVFGWSRAFTPAIIPGELVALMREADILFPVGDRYRSVVRVSSLRDGLFLHSAYPTTASDAVFFGPDSYRFAHAIEQCLSRRQGPLARAIDIGCGSGVGAITIGRSHPEADVTMTDINPVALRFAAINTVHANLPFVRATFSNLFQEVEGEYDLIVANPPYLNDPLLRAYRHGGGEHGGALSLAILEAALKRLAPGGTLLIYTGSSISEGVDGFYVAASAQLTETDLVWTYVELDPDVFGEELDAPAYASVERIAVVLLTVTKAR